MSSENGPLKYPKDLDNLETEFLCRNLYKKTDLEKSATDFFSRFVSCSKELKEDHFYMNVKIIVGLICCGLGTFNQFYLKFPNDKPYILTCVCIYAMISVGLLFLDNYFLVKLASSFTYKGEGPYMLYINLPMFSYEMTLTLKHKDKKEEITKNIANYWFNNGRPDTQEFFQDLNMLLGKLVGAKTKKRN